MKLIAIDPGYGRCGVAVLEGDNQKADLIFSTCIETNQKHDFSVRLKIIADNIIKIIREYNPELFVIETLFFSNNQKTALQVAEVRGMLIYIAINEGIAIKEIHPNSAKIALTGFGKATKDQMMFMVDKLIKISEKNRLDDEFDAIALGLVGLAESRN